MTPLQAATTYIERGLLVVPVQHRQKKPTINDWPKLRLTRETVHQYFNGAPMNVGLILGHQGLADVDLDCSEAIRAAGHFLPETKMIFGRQSKPRSHYFYYLDPPAIGRKYVDPMDKKAVILELRCARKDGETGLQTVAPPSIHETGEQVEFASGCGPMPANVDADVLLPAVAKTAAAALLARHFPAPQCGRNDTFLAIAGTLARAGWNLEDAIRFNSVIYAILWPGRPDFRTCESEVRPTFEKYAAGAEVTGFTRLCDLIDPTVVKAALGWLGVVEAKKEATTPTAVTAATITISNRPLQDISAEALRALVAANDPPTLFIRSGQLVNVAKDEKDRPIITIVTEHYFRGRLARSAGFVKASGKQNVDCPPPMDVVRDLMSLPASEMNAVLGQSQPAFPPLEGIVEVPILRPDGTVLHTPGYDPATRVVYMPATGLRVPAIPNRPTADDVDWAVSRLDEVLGEFPYTTPTSRANVKAALLTPILRRTFRGQAPACILDAPAPGTGKSLLGDIIALIATGRSAAMMAAPREDDEWRKRITSTLMTGATVIIVDNVEARLESAALAIALTAPEWADRVLGRSENVSLPCCATWIITGNNVRLGGDLPRRCYWARLDAKVSRPWLRQGFKHTDLLAWTAEHRGEILAALLILARSWFSAGSPAGNIPPIGGFESWTKMLGGLLKHAGIPDFLGNLDEMYKASDESGAQWEAFLQKLRDDYQDQPFTANQITERLIQSADSLRGLAPDDLAIDKPGSIQRRLGKAFSKRMDTRYGDTGIHLHKTGEAQRAALWTVRTSEFRGKPENPAETHEQQELKV